MSGRTRGLKEDWKTKSKNVVIVDENVATHLVRNAFGGKDQEMLCGIVGTQPPFSREIRYVDCFSSECK